MSIRKSVISLLPPSVASGLRQVRRGARLATPSALLSRARVGAARRMRGVRVNVGCGSKIGEGYVGCDVRRLPGVEIVCRAWELSRHGFELEEVYSRHMMEHLTRHEVARTLDDWFKALRPGGLVHIVVPDVDFHCQQWLRADWSEAAWQDKWSDARHAFSSLYGWQRGAEHAIDKHNPAAALYWDVHKSGFCKGLMTMLLKRHGFEDIDCSTVDKWHLVAKARKPLHPATLALS